MKKLVPLQDYQKVLQEYQGAYAQVWLFHVSLKRMAIRLSFPEKKETLFVVSVSTEYFKGPISWKNANISLSEKKDCDIDELLSFCTDKEAGFELISSGGISMSIGLEKGVDKSFDRWFGDEPDGL